MHSPLFPSSPRNAPALGIKDSGIRLIVLTAALLSSLCSINVHADVQQPTGPASDLTKVVLNGENLQLVESQGKCAVQRADQSLFSMDVNWPCFFSRTWGQDSDQKIKPVPRIEKFGEIPIVVVMNVKRPPSPVDECVSNLQALRLLSGQLEKSVTMDGTNCSLHAGDQKVFVGLFDRW